MARTLRICDGCGKELNLKKRLCKECSADTKTITLNNNLRNRYDIGIFEYQQMLKAQDYKCAICSIENPTHQTGRFVVDHNHNTGEARGLLCSRCNLAIAHFNEDKALMLKAIQYLE